MSRSNCSDAQDEYNKISKLLEFRLPSKYKMIGIITASLILLFLMSSKFFGDIAPLIKDVLRTLILLFLLLASLSMDSQEDEFSKYIRFQSFKIAFVIAISYSIIIPLLAFIFDLLITKITGDGSINFHQISAFEILFILLGIQLLFFETLKRFGRA